MTREQELELRIEKLEGINLDLQNFNVELQRSNADQFARIEELRKPNNEGAQWVLDQIQESRNAGQSAEEILVDLQTELELITGDFRPISSTVTSEKKPATPAAPAATTEKEIQKEIRKGIPGVEEALDEMDRRRFGQ